MPPEIARVESPGADLFQRVKSQNAPLILTGALKDWKAISKWSLDYLSSRLGTTRVNVEVSDTNHFPTLHSDGSDAAGNLAAESVGTKRRTPIPIKRPSRQVPFTEFADVVLRPNNGSEKFYLKDKLPTERFPDLASDISLGPLPGPTGQFPCRLWLSSAGAVTPLHYDVVHSLFAQVKGRKHFTLFAPRDGSSLYPFSMFSRYSYLSRVDILQPDLREFPKFEQAKPVSFTLEPGEVLYLPAFWWHQVQSLETSISISWFWRVRLSQRLGWPSLRALPAALTTRMESIVSRRQYSGGRK
ncbi:MAG: cupin-like domain-containing protein [Pyrinomonadaceae bacterium]